MSKTPSACRANQPSTRGQAGRKRTNGQGKGKHMSEHLTQAPVLIFVGMMAIFGLGITYLSVEDALRGSK